MYPVELANDTVSARPQDRSFAQSNEYTDNIDPRILGLTLDSGVNHAARSDVTNSLTILKSSEQQPSPPPSQTGSENAFTAYLDSKSSQLNERVQNVEQQIASMREAAVKPSHATKNNNSARGANLYQNSPPKNSRVTKHRANSTSLTIKIAVPKSNGEGKKQTLCQKMKQAKAFIATQKAQTHLAKKLGAEVSIAHSPTGVHIDGVYWRAPEHDITIPNTPTQMQTYIKETIHAILNNEGCREVNSNSQFRNRWATGATYYTPEEIEMAAQEVVVSINLKGLFYYILTLARTQWSTSTEMVGLRLSSTKAHVICFRPPCT